jgi:hypothetical protein
MRLIKLIRQFFCPHARMIKLCENGKKKTVYWCQACDKTEIR